MKYAVARGYFKAVLARVYGECWYKRLFGYRRSSLYYTIRVRKGAH